jgi:phage-related protein
VGTGWIRQVLYYRNFYLDFFETLKPEVKKKFNWTLQLVASVERVPEKYLKHLTGTSGLYEVRVEVGSDIYRVFSFFDKGNLVILLNGFQKKTQKTPHGEIAMAEKLRKQYYDEKSRQK